MGKILSSFKKNFIEQLIESLNETVPTYLYLFASKHTPWPSESYPPEENSSLEDSTFENISELLFGKKITSSDIAYLVNRYDWTSGTVYTQYDHRDTDIFNKQFFVVTDEKNVYKCISNNNGGPSTEKPTLKQVNIFEHASDKYKWKYLFTIDNITWNKFTTNSSIPIVANTAIQNAAKASIDNIIVQSGGSNYRTYTTGTVRSFPNTTMIQLDDDANINNRFYNNCSVYIYSGPGAGTLKTISNYIVNSSGKFVKTDGPMSGIVPNNSKYKISPKCEIFGDGTGALAVVNVNTSIQTNSVNLVVIDNPGTGYNNTDTVSVSYGTANLSIVTNNSGAIISVNILNAGTGYTSPPTLNIVSNTGINGEITALVGGYPISNVEIVNSGIGYTRANIVISGNSSFGGYANLIPIISPIGGHGANPASELNVNAFGIYGVFANNEGNTIYTEMKFRTVGIIKNPVSYSNNAVKFTGNTFNQVFSCGLSSPTVFTVGEEVVGQESKAVGTVVYSNSSILMMSGEKHFVNTEVIIGKLSNSQTNILNIINRGDLAPFSTEILYYKNIIPNQRANNQSETIKLVINL